MFRTFLWVIFGECASIFLYNVDYKWINIVLKSFIVLNLVLKLLKFQVVYLVQWMLDVHNDVIIQMF
jgi:hypothetical protein